MSLAGSSLPHAALALLVPPVRLISAFMWQIVQQLNVLQYDKLVEFITLATEMVPELLSPSHRAQLILGLRARVRTSYTFYLFIIPFLAKGMFFSHPLSFGLPVL